MKGLEPARSGFQQLAKAILRDAPEADAPLLAWPLACGTRVAEKTRATSFADGILTVEVLDPTWRGQLIDLAGNYLGSLNRLLDGRVQRIEFRLPENR